MKNIIFVIVFLLTASAFGQKLNDSLIVGTWRSEKVLKKPSNPNYRDIIDSFKMSVFKFKADHTFEISSEQNSQEFANLRKMTKGKSWKFDANTNTIKIGDAKDNFSTMKIKVKTVEGKTVFVLEETYHSMELEVAKFEAKNN
ncbi:hypothetical protein FLLO111716_12295 [Flavobacterium longum]|uniref:lipocalin family protein n=1 Tax=Flavobacterium longum TaxID=1299340 RepID=UPI0039E9B431